MEWVEMSGAELVQEVTRLRAHAAEQLQQLHELKQRNQTVEAALQVKVAAVGMNGDSGSGASHEHEVQGSLLILGSHRLTTWNHHGHDTFRVAAWKPLRTKLRCT